MYLIDPASREIAPYVWWRNVFSVEELDKLQEAAVNAEEEGGVGDGVVDDSIRRSTVKWLTPEREWGWVFARLGGVVAEVNAKYYGFNITGFGENIQLSNYRSNNNGAYGWHQDFGGKRISRKLSLAMQLSAPAEYKGGELEILTAKNPSVIEKERGLITIFPSWTLHQVAPVTEGTRQSLVLWVSGPEFK